MRPGPGRRRLDRLAIGVSLVGFGNFTVTKRAARDGINPATGAKIKIKASKGVKFKAGAALKKSVNK